MEHIENVLPRGDCQPLKTWEMQFHRKLVNWLRAEVYGKSLAPRDLWEIEPSDAILMIGSRQRQ